MKHIVLAVLLSGFVSTGYAQDKALLYEVSGKALAQPSYLFGTFHLLCPADLQLTDATRRAVASAKQVYLEIDLDEPGLQITMMAAMMLGSGRHLKDFLEADDFTALDVYMKRNLGAGLTQMGILKPVALSSFIAASMLNCEPASLDMTFAELAGKDGKEVLGLETIEQQMAIFDAVSIGDQLKGLVDMARKPEEAAKEFADLLAAYKAQDLPLLMKLMSESEFDGETEGFEEVLLDNRNMNWIPVIEKAAMNKPTFFAFGAGHLAGPKGVISLLRQRGYTVKAVQ